MTISGGRYTLGDLAAQYLAKTPAVRVAYVTDTAWSDVSRPGLLRLAHRARVLYCDSFYSETHRAQAEKHRHMTATLAAQYARDARVDALVLIHFAGRYEGRYETLLEEARAIFSATSAELA